MKIGGTYRKFIFVLALFVVETLLEACSIWLQTSFADQPFKFPFWFYNAPFLNALLIVVVVKVILFLPVYLVYYLRRKNFVDKFILHHLLLHSICLSIVYLVFAKYMINKLGIISFGLMTYAAIIAAFVFKQLLKPAAGESKKRN